MRLTIPLNSFNSVGPGQVGNLKLSPNRRVHDIKLQTGAADATELNRQVKEVRLRIGTYPLVKTTIPYLLALLAYYGLPVGAGEIPLYFSRPQVRTPTGEEFTAFNMFGIDDVTLEVEFRTATEYQALGGTLVGGTYAPTLSGIISFDLLNDGNRSFIRYVDRSIGNSGAGDVDFGNFEREGAYKAVHIFSSLVSRVRVQRDELEIIDRTLAQVDSLNRPYGLTRQSNHFPVDFGFTNQAQDVLEMQKFGEAGALVYQAKTFNFKLTTTGAGTLPVMVEHVIRV